MKNYLNRLLIGFIVLNINIICGQEIEGSGRTVVMSEANIATLAAKLKAYKEQRRKLISTQPIQQNTITIPLDESSLETRLLRQDIARLEEELATKKAYSNSNAQPIISETRENENMRDVKDELSELKFKISQLSNAKGNTPIIITTVADKPVNNDVSNDEDSSAYLREALSLQRQLDSLYSALKVSDKEKATDYSGNFDSLENQLHKLKIELETKNNAPTDYGLLREKYKDYQKRIFFANNATTLNTETVQIIDEINEIMNSSDNIDVLIKGFASNKGSTKVNEKLSMLRTEEVKKALILKGIHPTRILTQYHGIDYGSKDEADARRVEISLLIRK